MAAYVWASIQDVVDATGAVVDAPALVIATTAIETRTGLIQAVGRVYLSRRDYYWLKLAVCYQAAWMLAQFDYFNRLDAEFIIQDGQRANFRHDALTLAPMAKSAIRRLSWRGTRTLLPHGMNEPYRAGNPLAGNTAPLPQYIGGDPTTDGSDMGQAFR